MPRAHLHFILLSLLLPLGNAGARPYDPTLMLALQLYGNSVESKTTSARLAGTEIEAGIDRRFSETLSLALRAGVQLEAGSSQSQITDEFSPRQIMRVREASVAWAPWAWIKLRAGALNQDPLFSPLLLQRQTFPALEQNLQWASGAFRLALKLEQGIPNDTSTRQPWSSGPRVPQFFLERIAAGLSADKWSGDVWLSHFLFYELPGPSAFQSQFLGNSITGRLPANSVFRYGFQGFEGGTRQRVELSPLLDVQLSANAVINSAAPEGKNQAYLFSVGLPTRISEAVTLTPAGEWFRAESDAAPALFNNRVFGHNNRSGWGARLDVELPKEKVTVAAEFISSGVLQANSLQSNLQWFQLQLRSQYDWF